MHPRAAPAHAARPRLQADRQASGRGKPGVKRALPGPGSDDPESVQPAVVFLAFAVALAQLAALAVEDGPGQRVAALGSIELGEDASAIGLVEVGEQVEGLGDPPSSATTPPRGFGRRRPTWLCQGHLAPRVPGRTPAIVAAPEQDHGVRCGGERTSGVEPLVEQRELFVSLIAAGMSNSAACRQVGVNRKTGTRWRYGRSIPSASGGLLHYPPVIKANTSIVSSRYLSHEERVAIADLHRAGLNSRAIAAQVGRSPSTVSRELARNSAPDGRYRAASAQQRAAGRRRRPRARRLEVDPVLRGFVQLCMDVRWSPEQISHALGVEFPDDPTRQLVPESLYQALYAAVPMLKRTFRTRRWRRRRRPRRAPDARSSYRLATPMVMIDQRPAAADDRIEVGRGGRSDHGAGERLGDRHLGRALHPLADPGPPAARQDRGGCPRRPDCRLQRPAAGATPQPDVKSGQGAQRTRRPDPHAEHARLLLRAAQPLAAR